MTYEIRKYLVIVIYLLNFWEVDFVDNTFATTVIQKLMSQSARYGIPDIYVSVNGQGFNCEEFRKFVKDWKFRHETPSPTFAKQWKG